MMKVDEAPGFALVATRLGSDAVDAVTQLDLDAFLKGQQDGTIGRTCFSAVLNILLFHDLLRRVPSAAVYVAEQRASGNRICFDHGALRTIRFPDRPTGALPSG